MEAGSRSGIHILGVHISFGTSASFLAKCVLADIM
jgi:hypothetical protein